MPSSMTNDVETLKMLEFVPTLPQEKKATLSERQPSLREQLHSALKDSNLNSEEFKNEAEDNRGSELENPGSERHYPKERQLAWLRNVTMTLVPKKT